VLDCFTFIYALQDMRAKENRVGVAAALRPYSANSAKGKKINFDI